MGLGADVSAKTFQKTLEQVKDGNKNGFWDLLGQVNKLAKIPDQLSQAAETFTKGVERFSNVGQTQQIPQKAPPLIPKQEISLKKPQIKEVVKIPELDLEKIKSFVSGLITKIPELPKEMQELQLKEVPEKFKENKTIIEALIISKVSENYKRFFKC